MTKLRGKDVCYPWEVKEDREHGQILGFKGSYQELDVVLWNLHRLKYPYEELQKHKPPDRIVNAVESLIVTYDQMYTKNEVPWIFIVSESLPLLQAIAKILPVTWALSLKLAVMNVTPAQLVDLYSTRRPNDDFEPDPAGEAMHEMSTSSLLVWEQITTVVPGAEKQAGRFAEELMRRFERKRAMLVTGYTPKGFTEATAEHFMGSIAKMYGPTIAGLLEDIPLRKHLKVSKKQQSWQGEDV